MVDNEVGYRKAFRLRVVVKGRKHITVAVPYEVIERQATIRNLSVEQFVDKFMAIAEFNSFEGIRYTFKEAEVG